MVNSLSDPFIFDLIKNYGGNGYLVYFGTLEILGEQEAFNEPFVTTPEYMCHKLQVDVKIFRDVINYIVLCGKFDVKVPDGEAKISIFCPKFMEFSDNWTIRKKITTEQLPSNYRVTTEQLPNEEKRREEIRRDKKEKRKDNTNTLSAQKTADILEIEKFFIDRVKDKYKTDYMRNYGKDRRLLKNMISAVGKERIKSIITAFFNEPNYADCHTIGVLSTQINKLLQKSRKVISNGLPSADDVIKKLKGNKEGL